MADEVKERKNPDYTSSATDITSPAETLTAYETYKLAEKEVAQIELEIESYIPTEKKLALAEANAKLNEVAQILEQNIIKYGGFQRVEQGEYALIQISKRYRYMPELVREYVKDDKLLSIILIESVDDKMLKIFEKEGRLPTGTAERCAEITKVSKFIIR